MNKLAILAVFAMTLSTASSAQKKVVAVIGSSTAQGFGVDNPDSAWVKLIQKYWRELGEIDTIYNIAEGGDVTYDGLPTGFVSPLIPVPDSPFRDLPEPAHNVTAALAFNPDVVIVSYVSNDVGRNYSIAEQMFNLRTIYDTVIAAGKICYITTTQPRTTYGTPMKDTLLRLRDSVLLEFSPFALDFYTPVVAADSLNINQIYAYSGDGTHLNDAGHQQLFQVVKNNVILDATPLALSLTSFTGQREQQDVQLQWTDQGEDGPTEFEIQRSATAASFETIQTKKGEGGSLPDNYSWTDDNPLPGGGFYRLKITEPGKVSYSPIVSIGDNTKELTLDKIVSNSSQLMTGISTPKNQALFFTIMDRAGRLISRQTYTVSAPYSTISLPIANLAAGEYFLKIDAPNGFSVTKPFARF